MDTWQSDNTPPAPAADMGWSYGAPPQDAPVVAAEPLLDPLSRLERQVERLGDLVRTLRSENQRLTAELAGRERSGGELLAALELAQAEKHQLESEKQETVRRIEGLLSQLALLEETAASGS
ncbi:MAG: hypothetical protein H7831_08940 [Magnetococcus sp. WYHC-3]